MVVKRTLYTELVCPAALARVVVGPIYASSWSAVEVLLCEVGRLGGSKARELLPPVMFRSSI